MEKTNHAALAGEGGGHRTGKQRANKTLIQRPPTPHPRPRHTADRGWFLAGPGPPLALPPPPDPAGSRPRSAPSPTAGDRGPARRAAPTPTHPESKLARRGDSRHGVWPRSGRARGETRPPPSAAGRRARSRVPGALGARGRRPDSRAAAGLAAPPPRAPSPPRRGVAPPPSLADPPAPRSRCAGTANGSARLPGASKTTIRKWLQLNCLSAPPPRMPPRRGVGGDGRQLPERAEGREPPSPPLRPQTQLGAQGATRGIPPRSASSRPAARTHRVSGLRVHLAQVANHPNRFSWLRWAEARGSLALMAPRRRWRRRRRRRPAGSEGRLGRSRPPPGLA